MGKPVRKKKHDRLTHGDAEKNELRCDMAVAPFDGAARAMDEKWGIDRLPELVSPATAEKYGTALEMLNEAIKANDPARVAKVAAMCVRGMNAMDAEATASGAEPASAEVWEIEHQGHKIGIMQDGRNWAAIKKARPDLALYSLHEVAVALARLNIGVVSKIKEMAPGAEISEVRELPEAFWKRGGDEITF